MSNILSNLRFKIICLFVAVVGLLLINSSTTFAVTDAELDSMNLSLAEWTNTIVSYYSVLENEQLFMVMKYQNEYKLYLFTNLFDFEDAEQTIFFDVRTSHITENGTYLSYGDLFVNIIPYVHNDIAEYSNYNTSDTEPSDLSIPFDNYLHLLTCDYDQNGFNSVWSSRICNTASPFFKDSRSTIKWVDTLLLLRGPQYSTDYIDDYIYYTNIDKLILNSSLAEGSGNRPAIVTYIKNMNFEAFDYNSIYYLEKGLNNNMIFKMNTFENPPFNRIEIGGSSLDTTYTITNFSSSYINNYLIHILKDGTFNINFYNNYSLVKSISRNIIINEQKEEEKQELEFNVSSSNSNIVTWNNKKYFDKIDLFYKFNNIYGQYGSVLEQAPNVWNDYYYQPSIRCSVHWKQDNVLEVGPWISQLFDYFLQIPVYSAPGLYYEAYTLDPDNFDVALNMLIKNRLSNLQITSKAITDKLNLTWLFENNLDFELIVDFKIQKYNIVGQGDEFIPQEIVFEKSTRINFDVELNDGINNVFNLSDNDNDIGQIIVTKGGVVTGNLDDGYSIIPTENGYNITDPDNNTIYTVNKDETTGNWALKDADDNSIYTYVPIIERPNITDDFKENNSIDIGANVNSILLTIGDIFSGLYSSILSMTAIFSVIFNWLPAPIPQMIIFLFCLAVLFAIIRVIRGH